MDIQGIGIISSVGRGIEGFAEALQKRPAKPNISMYSSVSQKEIPVFNVDDSVLKDRNVLKNSRRSDRFCKMAVLAAWDALIDSGIEKTENERIGVIVSTSFGPHKTTFSFLDNILDYGDLGVSPTIFSHSVHNAAASYISSALNINGPVCTLTDFYFPFHEACKLAESWIDQGRCKHVLVGTVDELSPAMEYICDQKLNIRLDGKMDCFAFNNKAKTIPGEGSVFFLMSKKEENCKYCSIDYMDDQRDADIFILESDGMIPDESIYQNVNTKDSVLFNCSSLFGGIMSSTSFHCASAALMLKNSCVYPEFTKNEHSGSIENIVLVKYDRSKEKSIICLTK